MLKIKRVGETVINPFPVWPPLNNFDLKKKSELVELLAIPSGQLRHELISLRSRKDLHAERIMNSLGILYAHFYNYQDAPDLSGIDDGEAHLVRVKRIMEEEMIAHILGVNVPQTSDFDSDQGKVVDHLEHLSLDNRGVLHPFFEYVADEMPIEQMKEFLWLEVIRNEVVDDEVAMLVPSLQHSMKQVIASNLWDECGNGKIDGFHTTWLVRLLSSQDEWQDFMTYRETRPWFSMCTSHSFNSLLTTPGCSYHAYGTFLINESWVADHFERILRGMDRVNIFDDDRRVYFDAHYKIDRQHRLEMIEGLRQQYPALAQPRLREVLEGAYQAIFAGVVMYDNLLAYFRDGGAAAYERRSNEGIT